MEETDRQSFYSERVELPDLRLETEKRVRHPLRSCGIHPRALMPRSWYPAQVPISRPNPILFTLASRAQPLPRGRRTLTRKPCPMVS